MAYARVEAFIAFIALVVFGLARESASRLARDRTLPIWFLAVSTAAFPAVAGYRGLDSLTVLGICVVMALGIRFLLGKKEPGVLSAIGASLFLVFFVGLGAGFFVSIRTALVESEATGTAILIAFVIVMMAFHGGRVFGRRLGDSSAPAAGIAAAVLATLLIRVLVDAPPALWVLAAVGVVVGLAAQLGKAAMSMIIDPSAKGGVLDHLGAAMLAAPTYYLALRLFLL
jgi:CDP-diglyceride synthetase